jgi:uncharacterized protein YjbI with pentapeptide repeats
MNSSQASLRLRFPLLLACAIALLSCATALAAGTGAASAHKEARDAKVSLLYVLNAKRATLLPEAGSKTAFRLAVKGSEPNVDWFSDRPARDSGAFPAHFLASDWAGFGFAADPPNVAVDYVDSKGRDRTAMLVLRKPALHKSEIVFAAHLLDPTKVKDADLASHTKGADDTPPRLLRDVAVFVDDGEARVLNGCVLQPGTSCVGGDISQAYLPGLDLSGADLQGSFIEDAEFNGGNFTEANMSEANIFSTFEGSNLTDANMTGANLDSVFARGADLSGVNLTDADLGESHFEDANLSGAQTSGLNWASATFCRTVMPNGTDNSSGCNWLE